MSFKKVGKSLLCEALEAQVKQLRRRNKFTVVAVAGSVGKTSTKLAIAKLLSTNKKVIFQDGNYNDRLTVPLTIFGQHEPGIYNIFEWLKVLLANQRLIHKPFPFEIAIVEFGADGPDQLANFAYLKPELSIITAVAAEHMENFQHLDIVAKEELTPINYSKQVLLNLDDIDAKYLPDQVFLGYGQNKMADFKLISRQSKELDGQQLDFRLKNGNKIHIDTPLLGITGAKILLAAAGVANLLGWTDEEIEAGLKTIKPVNGRMKVLQGVSGSKLIDDTYNSSPSAAIAALDVLYAAQANQHIAILGTMNELGKSSQDEHRAVGIYCRPDKLDLLVTIGTEAEKNLASAASQNGCIVKSFFDPYSAGEFVKSQIKNNAVVLAKGSQNGVFAEEALKVLLSDPTDISQLVRQSPKWLKIKHHQFPAKES
ncbi:MAG TPA: Mur ligase family protein [Candidatus Saccharimonadales bacterium]|nr:Mur ligase family protein [Candidatus Saccharimonadales bacterium]